MGWGRKLKKAVKSGAKSVAGAAGNVAAATIGAGVDAIGKALTPDINIPEMTPEGKPVMPIPDEEAQRLSALRSRSRRRGRGGRSASILSGGDSLG